MSDAAASAPTLKKVSKTKKAQKPAAAHPQFSEMVIAAVGALKERKGSSAIAIKKYIASNYKVDEKKLNLYTRNAIKRAVASGVLKQVKGVGSNGSFRLAEKAKSVAKPKKKSVAKKAAKSPKKAKKPAAPKKSAKSPKKKSAAKKTVKKVAKSPAKKPVAKKVKKTPKKAAPKK